MRATVGTFRQKRSRRERPTWTRSIIRRFRIAASSAVLWALEGFEQEAGVVEPEESEVFPGIGFYSRPKKGSQAEAVVAKVGGESGHAVIVATRDLDALKLAGEGAEDETAIFNTLAIVRVRADGTIEIGAHGGPLAPLATKADLDALKAAIQDWTPVPNDGGAALKTALTTLFAGPPTWPAGTTKLRGQ